MPKKSKLDKVESEEVHKRVVNKFPRRPVAVSSIDDTWAADLVDMQQFSKENKGYKYILTVIDVMSKYAWAVPLKNKQAKTVLDAMAKIINESERQPEKLWIDKGSEFLDKDFQANFKNVYHTYSPFHAAPIERFNRTLKEKMWKGFTKRDSHEWVSRLPKLLHKYNTTRHSTIKMTPEEGSEKANEDYLLEYQEKRLKKTKPGVQKFKKGDTVRISRWKGKFEKGYEPNWSFELYKVDSVLDTKPITYRVRDLDRNEVVEGSFYGNELQKSKISYSKQGHYLESEWR